MFQRRRKKLYLSFNYLCCYPLSYSHHIHGTQLSVAAASLTVIQVLLLTLEGYSLICTDGIKKSSSVEVSGNVQRILGN